MRILIITSSTGGGHDMRARSLKLWAEKQTDWEIQIHQALESTHPLYAFGVNLYNWIQRRQPRLHHIYFKYLELASMHRNAKRMLGADRFRKLLADYRPDKIVSTHAHLNHGYFQLGREVLGNELPCITLCTEFNGGYGFSKHWANPDASLFIGSVRETVKAAVALGMPPDKTFRGGFMLRPAFHETQTSNVRFLQTQGLDSSKFTLLLATGAVGANNHLKLIDALRKRGKPLQVIALCGRNESVFKALERQSEQTDSITIKSLAYHEDMPTLLRSVSAIVTRPGAGTLSECIMTETPIIFNGMGGIMPQESLNVRYGESHGISRCMNHPSDLAKILNEWERHSEQIDQMKKSLRACKPERSPADIIDRINAT